MSAIDIAGAVVWTAAVLMGLGATWAKRGHWTVADSAALVLYSYLSAYCLFRLFGAHL